MPMESNDVEVKIARMEEQIRSLQSSVVDIKKLTDSVNTMANALERITVIQEQQATDIKSVGTTIEEIKTRPAKRWDTVVGCVMTALVTLAVTLIFNK